MQLIYRGSNTGVLISLSTDVLVHFHAHRQIKHNYEVGGQLFARFPSSGLVAIEKVSGPRKTDSKILNIFKPDIKLEQQEINDYFEQGYHFVGDWHTHPEKYPSPSVVDSTNIGNIFQKSKHTLNNFVLIIVGQAEYP
jgi:integrative and conjugative element protein (TIGR02256 family)